MLNRAGFLLVPAETGNDAPPIAATEHENTARIASNPAQFAPHHIDDQEEDHPYDHAINAGEKSHSAREAGEHTGAGTSAVKTPAPSIHAVAKLICEAAEHLSETGRQRANKIAAAYGASGQTMRAELELKDLLKAEGIQRGSPSDPFPPFAEMFAAARATPA